MKKAIGTRGAAAREVLANTARQYREVRAYFERFRTVINARAGDIKDYEPRVEYLGGRWLGLLRLAVEAVLSVETYDASKDKLALGRSALTPVICALLRQTVPLTFTRRTRAVSTAASPLAAGPARLDCCSQMHRASNLQAVPLSRFAPAYAQQQRTGSGSDLCPSEPVSRC